MLNSKKKKKNPQVLIPWAHPDILDLATKFQISLPILSSLRFPKRYVTPLKNKKSDRFFRNLNQITLSYVTFPCSNKYSKITFQLCHLVQFGADLFYTWEKKTLFWAFFNLLRLRLTSITDWQTNTNYCQWDTLINFKSFPFIQDVITVKLQFN
jgi:hypothetical protein